MLAKEKHLKYKTNCKFFNYDISKVKSNTYDALICTEVIEHVESPEKLIKESLRVLKKNGILIVSTPIKFTEKPQDIEHIQEWWPSEWKNLFKQYNVLAFEKSHPYAMAEMLNNQYLKIIINFMSIFFDLYIKRFWNHFSIQYAILKK